MKKRIVGWVLGISASLIAQPVWAHFPWLIVNKDGKAALFFGENIADRTYKLPESILKAKVRSVASAGKQAIELSQIDTEDFVGMVSKAKVADGCRLSTEVTYGIYHGNRLNYYASHIHGSLPTARSNSAGDKSEVKLSGELIDTDSGVDLYVSWNGKPLADVEVHLYCDEGHEEATAKTDKQGKVSFSDQQVEEGLNGIMLGHTAKEEGGKLGDQEYSSTMHYFTLTFTDPQESEK